MTFLKKPLARFILLVWILLLIPVLVVVSKYEHVFPINNITISSLAFAILLAVGSYLLAKINAIIATTVTLLIFGFSFFIRFILSFVYDFSGKGFTGEFFAHVSWKSFKVGLSDYGYLFFFVIFILLILLYVLAKLLSQIKFKQKTLPLILFVFAISALVLLKNSLPEWRFYSAFKNYYYNNMQTLTPEEAKKQAQEALKNLRPDKPFSINKDEIVVTPNKKPKNLIIIYLESFSEMLSENQRFPGLTPNIDKLKKDNFNFKNNFSSGYVTIEGIANSQCGTLIEMDNGNNSLLKKSGRLTNLPCLGDILKKAGYHQVYYGGADLGFAGKGAFLKEHGYDELKGLTNWRELSYETNTWGLVDNTLFDEALNKIRDLSQQKQPYNFTLLTLGTHIPGFVYDGCEPYNKAKIQAPYLDAIYCTDLLLGKFIEQLKQENLLDNTLLYIQGDHSIFSTHELTEIFTDQTTDRRILTIVVDKSLENKQVDENKLTSTYNLVANVLDLLDISHNVDFIFAQSDFSEKVKQNYFITRYIDYDGSDIITNALPIQIADCAINTEVTPPLDKCEKKRVMNSIYQLNHSYSAQDFQTLQCVEASQINVNPYDNSFTIKWNGENITKQFYSRGRRITSKLPGLYLVELNKEDEVIQLQFFLDRDLETLSRLNKYLTKGDGRFLLFTNLTTEQMKEINLSNLPDYFYQNKWLYADINQGVILPISKKEMSLGSVEFFPFACHNELTIKEYQPKIYLDPPNEFGFCKVKAWGAKKTIKGKSFNTQKTGLSAFWMKTDCAPEGTVIRINGKDIKTHVGLPVITAAVDDKTFFPEVGNYQIELFDAETKATHKVGDFTVMKNPSLDTKKQL